MTRLQAWAMRRPDECFGPVRVGVAQNKGAGWKPADPLVFTLSARQSRTRAPKNMPRPSTLRISAQVPTAFMLGTTAGRVATPTVTLSG